MVRWKLLPLLLVGIGNVFLWYWVFVPYGVRFFSIFCLAIAAVLAGMVTPKGLWWFSISCIMLPPLMMPGYHGIMLGHLLFGFIYPLLWIYFLVNAWPVYAGATVFVLAGYGVRRLLAGTRWEIAKDSECIPVHSLRLTFLHFDYLTVIVLGNWIGYMRAIADLNNVSPPPSFVVPGVLVGAVVSRLFGEVAGQFATALGNGAIYGVVFHGALRLLSARSQ